jgi:radical SAM superfamily enzyme YgiQ (UPF0313 family)
LNALLIGLNAKYIHVSLALYSLSASCRAAGRNIEVAEYTINQDLLYILGDISRHTPDIVGFSCYIWNREMVLQLATALKQIHPKMLVVLGGPEASPDAVAILAKNWAVDFVVQGEGEESLPELLAALCEARKRVDVAGVAWRNGEVIELNGGVRVVEDLDRLPFPYRPEQMKALQHRILYYESSRGCPFSCSYCVSSTNKKVRHRSLALVKKELEFFLRHEVKQVKFVDRTFNVQPEHYWGIWRFLAERAAKTNFHFEIVADQLSASEVEWLITVPAVGLFQFEIGVQSTCEETLAAISRRNQWERLQDNIQKLIRAGNIHLHLDLIVGLPHETTAEFARSFNGVYELKPNMLQIGFLKMLPGTKIRDEAAKYDYVFLSHPPYEVLANRMLPYRELQGLKEMERVFEQTYNSGHFQYTLAYMVECFEGNAFLFYTSLTRWWATKGLSNVAHSPEGVLEGLSAFVQEQLPLQQTWANEVMKFDVLTNVAHSLKGSKLHWNQKCWERKKSNLWRNERIVSRYISDYRFTNWRDIKRHYPLEVFAVDVPGWIASGQKNNCANIPVLFDKSGRCAAWHVLTDGEFPLEDED